MSFDVRNFQEDVLAASEKLPVVVDFWAPWCGPCRVLGPVLEKLAREAEGIWKLVKINSDEHQEIASQYHVRGIPSVKLFSRGTVIDEFTGALPEHAVRQWLESALPSPVRELMTQAESAMSHGRMDEAAASLSRALELEPDNESARILLAGAIAITEPERARELINGTSPSEPALFATKEAVQQIVRLGDLVANPDGIPDGEGAAGYLDSARHAVAGRWADAVAGFIDVIGKDRYYDDDGARKSCIAIFNLLGPSHEVTQKYRRLFDMALY